MLGSSFPSVLDIHIKPKMKRNFDLEAQEKMIRVNSREYTSDEDFL